MKYIRKVILENFQSHKYNELEFGPELNVIVGPSDSGKSAIIRALKWVMYNEPAGDFFIREGEKECKVTLELSDGTILQRYRTRSKNGYRLVDNNGDESIFEGIGLSVPQEIIDITGIRKIKLDSESENAINLGEQLEGAFLLTEKSSTRANAIGRLVGVDIVDDALRDVLRDIRSLNQSRKQKEEILQTTADKLSKFDYIEDMKAIQTRVSSIMENIHKLYDRTEKLEQINDKIQRLSGEIYKNKVLLDELSGIGKTEVVLDKAVHKVDSLLHHTRLYDHYKGINISKVRAADTLETIARFIGDSPSVSDMELKVLKLLNLQKIDIANKWTMLERDKVSVVYERLKKIDFNYSSMDFTEAKIRNCRELSSLRDKLVGILGSKDKGILYMGRLQPLIVFESRLKSLEEKTGLLRDLLLYTERYDSIKNEVNATKEAIHRNNEILKDILGKYSGVLKRIEKCPYCLGDIDEETIEHILTHHLGG